jgi:hypothetical protein
MSKQFNTYRVGIESMTETQLGWWEKKGVTYKCKEEFRLKTVGLDSRDPEVKTGLVEMICAING